MTPSRNSPSASYGARVADIGASTGLATALLHVRDAHVIADEPGLAPQLRLTLPDVLVVLGGGNRPPTASEFIDILTIRDLPGPHEAACGYR
ncbi:MULTISPECIES: hypothetical protein [Streptomyces]|uniref:Uncharacterized protein n=2 Tax=Streptomyces TaxID=1883 RepID=A0ABV9JC18_9ACTN